MRFIPVTPPSSRQGESGLELRLRWVSWSGKSRATFRRMSDGIFTPPPLLAPPYLNPSCCFLCDFLHFTRTFPVFSSSTLTFLKFQAAETLGLSKSETPAGSFFISFSTAWQKLSALIRTWPGSKVLKCHVLECCFKVIYHRDQGCEEAPAIICYSSFPPRQWQACRPSPDTQTDRSLLLGFFSESPSCQIHGKASFFSFNTTGFLEGRNARHIVKVVIFLL